MDPNTTNRLLNSATTNVEIAKVVGETIKHEKQSPKICCFVTVLVSALSILALALVLWKIVLAPSINNNADAKEEIQALTLQLSNANAKIQELLPQLNNSILAVQALEFKVNGTYSHEIQNLQQSLNNNRKMLSKLQTKKTILQRLIDDTQNEMNSQLNTLEQDSEPSFTGNVTTIRTTLGMRQELINSLQHKLGTVLRPALSCGDLQTDMLSGFYWIDTSTITPMNPYHYTYCTRLPSCTCSRGGWTRIAYLDMTDTSQQCPDGFRLNTRTTAPLRTCGRPDHMSGCVSVKYRTPLPGIHMHYSRVCGKIKAYQYATTDAFGSYNENNQININDTYVDGVSLTHGSTRQHIWTFANALDEARSYFDKYSCECTDRNAPNPSNVPPFVGNDYFCDTGSRIKYIHNHLYADDPLWDGRGCGSTSSCCELHTPPWFCKQLTSTTDYIELRLCGNMNRKDEDTLLEKVEIYIR